MGCGLFSGVAILVPLFFLFLTYLCSLLNVPSPTGNPNKAASSLTQITHHTEESLLVLRGLGIQTSSSSPTYLSTSTTRFIPTTAIQDIFIHEAFKGFEVRFYLAIVVRGEEDVVVVFPVSHVCSQEKVG